MSDAVIGIAGSQKKQQTDATSARNSSKTWHRKAKIAGAIGAVVLCILTWWKNLPVEVPKTAEVTSQQEPKQSQQMAEASWKGSAGETLPVGVWSEDMKILPGCTVHFDAGNGTAYTVEYKLYGNGWKQHTLGSNINGDTVRFILHKEEVKRVPVRVTC